MFHGDAGWGMTNLRFFAKTQRQEYLDHAVGAAQWLVDTAIRDELGLTWAPGSGEESPLGFAFGASGVGLFLMLAGHAAGEDRFVESAMEAFELASKQWYEIPTLCSVRSDFQDEVRSHLPESGWHVRRSDIWLHVDRFVDQIPEQGFKIHVSSIPDCAKDLLGLVTRECVARDISFKCAAGPELLEYQNGKNRHRGAGGKFITIYPPSHEVFLYLLEALYEETAGKDLVGPYILSDRRYKDSRVIYYRYGGMRFHKRLMSDGLEVGMLVGPDGSEMKDQRQAFFSLPPWVEDPFDESDEGDDGSVIGGSFEVTTMIYATNRGGVYEAIDMGSGNTVVIKEARPHVHRTTRGTATIDSHLLLEHEYDVLRHLEGLDCTVRPIKLFREWEHLFMAEEKVQGVILRTAVGQPDDLWLPYARDGMSFDDIQKKFHRLGESLLDAVEAIHARGVIISDLSANNVMVDPDSWDVRLIDFEAAIRVGKDEHMMPALSKWTTPGYVRKERITSGVVNFDDDYYAASRVLLNALVPTGALSALNPGCHATFISFLLDLGVPEWVADLIEATAVGDVSAARVALAQTTGIA